jgi:hypothetical protein
VAKELNVLLWLIVERIRAGMAMRNYDVFISYRRGTSAEAARLIRERLNQKEWRAFLDVDDLKKGYFDETLLTFIAEAPNFMIVLSPGSLDRCAQKGDWLCWEVAHALRTGRNIIPISMPSFEFPTDLPKEIDDLRRREAIEYHHTYFDAMMDRIIRSLVREETEQGRFARERTEIELRAAAQAEAEHKAREKSEAERRQREKAEVERLAAEREEAERKAREEQQRLSPRGRKAAAAFRGEKMVNEQRLRRRSSLCLRLGVATAAALALATLAAVLYKQKLGAFAPLLAREKLLIAACLILCGWGMLVGLRSPGRIQDALFDLGKGWWLIGLRGLVDSLLLKSDDDFVQTSVARELEFRHDY